MNITKLCYDFSIAMMHWAVKGFPVVDRETYIDRLSKCEKCSSNLICPECKCMMKLKAALTTSKCKRHLWN